MNTLLTTFLLIAQAVSVVLIIGTITGWRIRARDNRNRSMHSSDPAVN